MAGVTCWTVSSGEPGPWNTPPSGETAVREAFESQMDTPPSNWRDSRDVQLLPSVHSGNPRLTKLAIRQNP